jgi:protein gp37
VDLRACLPRAAVVDQDWWNPRPTISAKSGVDWVIVGGESGPGARPLDLSWARHLREQCDTAGVPYFFKQMGENVTTYNGLSNVRFREKGSSLDDIPADLRVRQFPTAPAA